MDIKKLNLTPEGPVKKRNGPFSNPWEESDAVLIVEGNKLHVHTSILSMLSPVFKAMFTSGFKESQTKQVDLKEKKFEDVELMLKAIYPQHQLSLGRLDERGLRTLFDLSQEYKINSLKATVEHHALKLANSISVQNTKINYKSKIFQLLRLADEGNFQEVIVHCAVHIAAQTEGLFAGNNKSLDTLIGPSMINSYSILTKFKICAQMIKARHMHIMTEQKGCLSDDYYLKNIIEYMAKLE